MVIFIPLPCLVDRQEGELGLLQGPLHMRPGKRRPKNVDQKAKHVDERPKDVFEMMCSVWLKA